MPSFAQLVDVATTALLWTVQLFVLGLFIAAVLGIGAGYATLAGL